MKDLSQSDLYQDLCADHGLVYTCDSGPGICRIGAGTGFYYRWPCGNKVSEKRELERIRSLAIPPAYREVWICPDRRGHLQVTGRDGKGRKQYRYHPDWIELRDSAKWERLPEIGRRMPKLRRWISCHLGGPAGERETVIASCLALIERTGQRVGNETHLRFSGTRGITTLRPRHTLVDESIIHLRFIGKGGREIDTSIYHPRLARSINRCSELPGQRLFTYRNQLGDWSNISSQDVNDVLKKLLGQSASAKDLRSWRACTKAVEHLRSIRKPVDREKEFREAVEKAAAFISNRYATCRKHYVAPQIEAAFLDSGMSGISRRRGTGPQSLSLSERVLLQILR